MATPLEHDPQRFLEIQQELEPSARVEALVTVLRGPSGCPWDQKQQALDILDHLIDEAHELKQALLDQQQNSIEEEYGDLFFTWTFLAQTMKSNASLGTAVQGLVSKMISRHPHVFVEGAASDLGAIRRNWEENKSKEKARGYRLDEGLPASLPPLRRATKLLRKVRSMGFRYPERAGAWDKLEEELTEFREVASHELRAEAEFGDLLLALLTLALEYDIDADRGLLSSSTKLMDRLETLQKLAGKPLSEIEPERLPGLYRQAKNPEESPSSAYLNYCSVSPWPSPVRAAVRRAAHKIGTSGLQGSLELRQDREALRQSLALLLGGKMEQVVFVPNVSSAALGVSYCLDWGANPSVLLGQHEFPANTVPWRLASRALGFKVLEFDEDQLRREPERGWEALESLLERERPRLLALSAVSFWSGYRVPVRRLSELCAETNTLLYLDAIQAVGPNPISMKEGIDFLAGGSHKTLLSPEGAGFLLVSERGRRAWVPRLGSWLSLPDPIDFLLNGKPNSIPNGAWPRKGDPSTLEGGSLNVLGYAGLKAAVDWLLEKNPKTVWAQIQSLQDKFECALSARGWISLRAAELECRSSILSFDPPPNLDLPTLVHHLNQAGVACGMPNGRLRFGFHLFNSESDLEALLKALDVSMNI